MRQGVIINEIGLRPRPGDGLRVSLVGFDEGEAGVVNVKFSDRDSRVECDDAHCVAVLGIERKRAGRELAGLGRQ